MNVFALSVFALGSTPASATSSSSWFVGSLSGPEMRGANAGPADDGAAEDDVDAVAVGEGVGAEERLLAGRQVLCHR